MNISTGRVVTAQKVVLYGPEGIGKTLFAAKFPDPIFIDTEGSTKNYDVKRFDRPSSWQAIKDVIKFVKNNKPCKTLVIDTFDWAEALCLEYICSSHNKKGIEEFGYGNGYVYEKEEVGRFLNSLDEIISVGINVVLTAHAQLKKFEQPDEMGAYDRWELKLGKKTSSQISPLVKEWADMVLFANYETFAVQTDKDGKKFKAQGGNRVMFTQHHPCWDAKNRFGLAEKLPLDYKEIQHIFGNISATKQEIIAQLKTKITQNDIATSEQVYPPVESKSIDDVLDSNIPKALRDLMQANDVTEKDVQVAVSQKGYYPESTPIANYDANFINGVCVGAWDKVFALIKKNQKEPF